MKSYARFRTFPCRPPWWVTIVIMGLLSLSFLLLRTKLELPGGELLPGVRLFLGILALFILAGLVISRRYFTTILSWNLTTTQVIALVAVMVASAYGVLGTYALRDEFGRPDMKWHDAVYFTIVTYTTLGYGDIVPVGEQAKWFTVSMVLVGISTFITAAAAVLEPFIRDRLVGVLRFMGRSENKAYKDHVIVCGYTNVGQSVADYLFEQSEAFVIVESDPFLSESALQRGLFVIRGNPTLEETLLSAQIDQAASVITCLDDDAHNVMITLIASDLRRQARCRDDLRIIARAENQSVVSRMKSAGADYVLSPSTVAGKAMAQLSIEPDEENRGSISTFWK